MSSSKSGSFLFISKFNGDNSLICVKEQPESESFLKRDCLNLK